MSEFILPQQTGDEVDLLRHSALFQNVKIVNAKAMEQGFAKTFGTFSECENSER